MAYEDILAKYKKTNPEEEKQESSAMPIKVKEVTSLKDNPYKSVVETYKTNQFVKNYNQGTRDTEASIEKDLNPGVKRAVIDTAKGMPRAMAQIGTDLFKHPIKSGRAVVTGALDTGPAALNTLHMIGRSILGFVYGKDNAPEKFRMPKVGESLADYLDYERSDTEVALGAGTEMFAGYKLGEAPFKALGFKGLKADIPGDILGGQIISEADNMEDRATQALFDGLFGVTQVIGGRIFRKVKAKAGEAAHVTDLGEVKAGELDDFEVADVQSKPTEVRAFSSEPDAPKTAYVPKDDLGLDSRGKQIMATTEVDTKTGDAVVYYLKSLDDTPDLRAVVWDFEEPHILDKRLGKVGESFTPALQNPSGNLSILEAAVGSFSKKLGQSIDEVAITLRNDIQRIANNDKVITEQFADAFGIFKSKPDLVRSKAPILAKFFDHQLVDSRFAKQITTEADLAKNFPEFKNPGIDDAVDPIGKRLKAIKDVETSRSQAMGDKEMAGKRMKGDAMSLAAIERKLRGRPTAKEISNTKNFLNSNYTGKKATVDGKPVVVTGKATFGKHEVIFRNGVNKYVPADKIKAKAATNADAIDYLQKQGTQELKAREGIYGLKAPKGQAIPKAKEVVKAEETAKAKEIDKQITELQSKEEVKVEKKDSKFSSTGLDTKKRVKGKSSFNPNQIDAPEDVEILFNKMDAGNENFSSQRISKGNEDLKDLARMTGLTEDDLIEVGPGSIANSETLVAARQIVLNKAAELSNKLKGVNVESASLAEKEAVRDAFLKLVSMQKSVAGLRTEASHVLRSFGVKLRPGENIAIDELIANLKKMGVDGVDPSDLDALAGIAGKVAKEMELTMSQKVGKGALQTWYASILSGPKTSVRNIMSTTANILSDIVSKSANPKQWPELKTSIEGLVKGFKESAEPGNLKKIFTLQATDPITGKFYDVPVDAGEQVFSGKFERFGKIVEIPGRILTAQDRRFSGAARGLEEAAQKVYKGDMTEATMKAISDSYAISSVYRGLPKGRAFRAASSASLTFLRVLPEGRIVMPFVQTIANVLDRQFDYLPIFSALRLGKFKVKVGGKVMEFGSDVIERQADEIAQNFGIKDDLQIEMIKGRLRDQQIGRMNLGLGISGLAIMMAKDGRVSGSGPSNYSERVALQRTGWRPNSIKIGDTWVPYLFLGPLGGIFAMAGNVHDSVVYDDKPDSHIVDLIGHGVTGWMRTQLDNSFLSGLSDLLEAVGPGGNPKKYVTELGMNLIPIPQLYTQTMDISKNLLSYATGDEALRQQYETRTITDKLRRRLGLTGDMFGIADELNPRLDQFGQPMTSDLIWGISPSVDKRDAMGVDNFLINNEVVVSLPVYTREYSVPGTKEKRQLTEEEFNKYVERSGKEIYRTLNSMLPTLEGLPKEQAQKQVKSIVDGVRKRVRNEVLVK